MPTTTNRTKERDIKDCIQLGIALGTALGRTARIWKQIRFERVEMLKWWRCQWAK